MNAIDREAAADAIHKANMEALNTPGNWMAAGRSLGLTIAENIIRSMPAVEAEPVRHCENVTHTHPSDMFVCSRCGFSCEITELRHDEDDMENHDAYEYDCKFCPDCGAKYVTDTPCAVKEREE